MTTNLYTRLRALLPAPPVLIGRVIAHHEEDDTSTVELPIGVGLFAYVEGLASGSLLRPRGRTVAVGLNAFVRNGVVESQAPDGVPLDIEVGDPVACAYAAQAFSGPVPAQAATVGVPFTLALADFFGGGFAPFAYSLAGTPPAGLAVDADTGTLAGTPSGAEVAAGLVATRTDATGQSVASNAFTVTVT